MKAQDAVVRVFTFSQTLPRFSPGYVGSKNMLYLFCKINIFSHLTVTLSLTKHTRRRYNERKTDFQGRNKTKQNKTKQNAPWKQQNKNYQDLTSAKEMAKTTEATWELILYWMQGMVLQKFIEKLNTSNTRYK